jgi:hypothetical protein
LGFFIGLDWRSLARFHPMLIERFIKNCFHEFFEVSVIGDITTILFLVDFGHNLIQKAHDDVIISTIFPELKFNFTGEKVIVCGKFGIVD